jgi:hypothetical protein
MKDKKMIKDNEVEKKDDYDSKKETKKWESLTKQIQYEYDLAWENQKTRKDEILLRLKLYNNQRRDKDAAGDTTMFTIMQTLLASLYTDRLMVDFNGREEGDDDVADNLNAMAKFDYDEMQKDELDFDYAFDTCFTGHGLINQTEYIRDPENNIFLPVAEVVDPLTFLRDPRAVRINGKGLLHKNSCRFFGREIKMSKQAMKENSNFFKDIKWEDLSYEFGVKSMYDKAMQARNNASGHQTVIDKKESNLGCNAEYSIIEWYTHYEVDGKTKKVRAWLGNNRSTLLGVQVMPDGVWGWNDRLLYPTSHDWDGTSIPDLTEDKQRARAVLQNLGIKALKSDLYPAYIYDYNKITNRNDLNLDLNKMIPADNPNQTTIQPVQKAVFNMQLLNFIYTTLDISAQKATATPDVKQGMQSEQDRTLGETNIIASASDTRYSLSAKLFGANEKRFWQQWYRMYKEYFKEGIDEKIVRISGAFGNTWRTLAKDQLITKRLDPDIVIESTVVSRAKQMEDRAMFTQYLTLALQDPTVNRRYGFKKLAKLNGMEKDEIDRLFPPTVDERIAEGENQLLSEDKSAVIHAEDDHNVHLDIHNRASDTPAKMAHMATHIKALSIKKTKPELFPTPEGEDMSNMNPPGTENVNTDIPTAESLNNNVNPNQSSGGTYGR